VLFLLPILRTALKFIVYRRRSANGMSSVASISSYVHWRCCAGEADWPGHSFFAPERQIQKGIVPMMRAACARQNYRRLTFSDVDPKVCLSELGRCLRKAGLDSVSSSDFDESSSHSRDAYVLQSVLCCVRTLSGLDSEAISDSQRPTRLMARWAFCFELVHPFLNSFGRCLHAM